MSWTGRHIPFYLTPATQVSGLTLVLAADDAAGSTWTRLTGDPTSRWGVTAIEWAGAQRTTQWSGERGTIGARSVGSRVQNAPLKLALTLTPDGHDDAADLVSELQLVVEAMARFGGQVTLRRSGATHRQHFQVLAGDGVQMAAMDATNELHGRATVVIQFTVGPLVLGDPMEVWDPLDTAAALGTDWAWDQGSAASVQVTARELAPTTPAPIRTAHLATGYSYGDARASVTGIPGATITGHVIGVVVKRTGVADRIEVVASDDGTQTSVSITRVVAGASTVMATAAAGTRLATGIPTVVSAEVVGNRVQALLAGAVVATWTLTGADITRFGHRVQGLCGLVWDPRHTGARLRDFRVEPFSLISPGQLLDVEWCGDVPGDAPALTTVEVVQAGLPYASATFAALSLDRVCEPGNLVADGQFLTVSGAPWSTAAVAGVTSAATSLTIASSGAGRFGDTCGEATLPATSGAGVACRVRPPGGFEAGRTYTARAWVRSASASTPVQLCLGVNGSLATGSAAALTPGWVMREVTWTPAADAPYAYVAVRSSAATAAVMRLDGVQVWETEPTASSQVDGAGGQAPAGVLTPATAHTLAGFAVTSVAASWPTIMDLTLRSTATTSSARWRIDPLLVDPDDHSDNTDVEVWAWITVPAGLTNPVGIASCVGGVSGVAAYTREYGAAGAPLTGMSGIWRLGTITVPRLVDAAIDLRVEVNAAGGSGTTDIPWVMLLRPGQRVAWPTGKGTTGYPRFIPATGSAAASTKRLLQDGRGVIRSAGDAGFSASSGAAQPLTIPPGPWRLTGVLAAGVPNSSAATSVVQVQRIRVSPTPRWHYLRS